jgi:uncharacterized membrane protein
MADAHDVTAKEQRMRTKAAIAGHPIHPMLVAFPIALYTATVAALLAYVGTNDPFWYRAALASNVAGLIMAAFAIIPGSIDLFSLPKDSPARITGYKHAGFNVVTSVLFLINAFLLWHGWGERVLVEGRYFLDATVPLALSIVGVLTMVIAGVLGWKMVQTHHVGISDVADERALNRYDDQLEPWTPPRGPKDTTGRHTTLRH